MPPEARDAGSGPSQRVTVPAELRFLTVLRQAVGVVTDDLACDARCREDLQLATDELAATLIQAAHRGSDLVMDIHDDDHDLYVRMRVPVASEGFRPDEPDLTRMLLDAAVDSYEVRVHRQDVVAVIQRAKKREPHV